MGCRNPYSISLDAKRKAVTWGDIGPDGVGITEEYDYTKVPGNFGYPYFAGDNVKLSGTGTPDKPINANARNTGLTELPKAIPAMISYKQEAAITGPIFYYNSVPNSSVKLPPHFDGLWFVTDFQTGTMDTVRMNADGTAKVAQGPVFPSFKFDRPVDLKLGPDGALYVINYAGWFGAASTTGIVRVEYAGSCRTPVGVEPRRETLRGAFRAYGRTLEVTVAGAHDLTLSDLNGRAVAAFRGEGAARYDLSPALAGRAGTFLAVLETPSGRETRRIVIPR
jgi:cytochrome c